MKLSRLKLAPSVQRAMTNGLKLNQSAAAIAELPNHMSCWQCLRFLAPDSRDVTQELHCTSTRRLPTLSRPDHILVKVARASLNPIDLLNLYGYGATSFHYARLFGSRLGLLGMVDQAVLLSADQSDFPWTPGRDFAGTVVGCAPSAFRHPSHNTGGFVLGQRVVGATWPFLSSSGSGALSQYVVCPAAYMAQVPHNVTFEQAVAIGYSGLTAWSALVAGGFSPRPCSTLGSDRSQSPLVLVTGATGGVGLVAAQVAKLSGARVHVTCPSDSKAQSMMKELGMDDVIVYPDRPAVNVRYDLIIDCIRPKGLHSLSSTESPLRLARTAVQNVAPLYDYLQPASTARYVNLNSPFLFLVDRLGLVAGAGASLLQVASTPFTLATNPWSILSQGRVTWAFFQPSGYRLAQLLRWASDGRLQLFVDSEFSFDRVPDAVARLQTGGVRGKIIVRVAD